MKYLKFSLIFLIVCILSNVTKINATIYVPIYSETIPVFKGTWKSEPEYKNNPYYEDTPQYIYKTGCVDNSTGEGRVILAKLHGGSASSEVRKWREAKPKTYVSFGDESRESGSWELWLQSKKFMATSATFSGIWYIER